jgi:integrase/recombinase XerC
MTATKVTDALTGPWADVASEYRAALERADLSPHARRGYASRVAGYLAWLEAGPDLGSDVDPLTDPAGRDYAVRDYRRWLKTVRRAKPSTINSTITALEHFYTYHLRLGRPEIRREHLQNTAPEALEPMEQRRFLRAAGRASERDAALALTLFYSGLRVAELAALNLEDVPISARRGKVVVRAGKGRDGGTYREVPLHHAAREALQRWLTVRATHPGARDTDALFLSRLGDRLGDRSIRSVIGEVGRSAGLVDDDGEPRVHPHTLRHTFGTNMVREGVDLVTVADLMGHARVDTTRGYARSSLVGQAAAIEAALMSDE